MTTTFDRLVIFKDKLTQKVDQSIVTYIPDQDYLARHNNDVSHNQITRLDSDFSGYIQYRNWDDKLQFVLQIQNGKSVKVLKYNSSGVSATAAPRSVTAGSVPRQTDAIVCTTQTIYHFEQMCYYTVTEEGTTESCGDWQYAGSDTYTDCYDDGSGDPATGDPCIDYGYCTTPVPPSTPPPPPPNITVSNIVNNLKNPCLLSAFNSLTTNGIKSYIVNLFNQTFTNYGNQVNVDFEEDATMTNDNGSPLASKSQRNASTHTWTITLNPTFSSTSSVEWLGSAIIHEIVHAFIVEYTVYNPANSDFSEPATHTAMLNSWINQMSSTLQQSFGISAADGIAIALSGISDVLMDNNLTPFPAMDAFVQKNYNTTIAAAGVIGNAYEAGTKGKKCP